MRSSILACIAALAALGTASAAAACIYPRPPESVPDGRTATYDQMVEGQTAVKSFDADVTAYTACLQMERDSLLANPELDEARRIEIAAMYVKKNNAAVDEVQSVADRFNEQLRAFKDRSKKD